MTFARPARDGGRIAPRTTPPQRRHTAFASVDVTPDVEEDADIELIDSELKIASLL